MITSIKAQDLKPNDIVIYYVDPDGDSDEYDSYQVESVFPTVVTTALNRYHVIELTYREIKTGELSTRQVNPEYPFRILKR